MSTIHRALAQHLFELEGELRALALWQSQKPSAQALASREPFAVDTLEFYQWLQFVFIPRLEQVAQGRAPVPQNCGVAPMAEEFFRAREEDAAALIQVLAAIDDLITRS